MYIQIFRRFNWAAVQCSRSKLRDIIRQKSTYKQFHATACLRADKSNVSPKQKFNENEENRLAAKSVMTEEGHEDVEANAKNKTANIQISTEPYLTDTVKPLVKFRRRPKGEQDIIPDLRKNPVDMREIPKQYEITPEERRYISKSEEIFEEVKFMGKSVESLRLAMEIYKDRAKVHRRGQTEFIYTCLDKIQEFNAHKELSVYKEIMTIFPEDKLKADNPIKAALMHKPREQQCAIDVLDTMESNGVIADDNMGYIIGRRFGIDSYVMRKYERSMFWMPKFRNANPYPIPLKLPNDAIELAKMALKRMAVDVNTKIDVWQTTEMEESPAEDTFVASAMSPLQEEILVAHPSHQPLVVEGGSIVWLRDQAQTYYVLKAEWTQEELRQEEERKNIPQDVFDPEVIAAMFEAEEAQDSDNFAKMKPKSWDLHRQPDGTVLAMCITGTCSKNSLMSWIRYLSLKNPQLVKTPILFSLRNPAGDVDLLDFSDIYKNSTTI